MKETIRVASDVVETELPEGMILNKISLKSMMALEEKGVVVVEGDDGAEFFEAKQQLKEIAEEYSWHYFALPHTFVVVDQSHRNVPCF